MNHSPLVIYPERTITLPPRYCGNVDYYALMAQYGSAVIDFSKPYNKRAKECHRCEIEGANGMQRLTVPIEKGPTGSIAGLRVSDHGEWWNVHWGAIYSAYGRTPYFEFYADDFLPAFQGTVKSLMELDIMLDKIIRRILGITTHVSYRTVAGSGISAGSAGSACDGDLLCDGDSGNSSGSACDGGALEQSPSGATLYSPGCQSRVSAMQPYYQVWASRFGFTPGLSILDLIFNMGTEAPLILHSATIGLTPNAT